MLGLLEWELIFDEEISFFEVYIFKSGFLELEAGTIVAEVFLVIESSLDLGDFSTIFDSIVLFFDNICEALRDLLD